MDLGQRYHGLKGVRELRQEDVVLGSLGPPGNLEESASHQERQKLLGFTSAIIHLMNLGQRYLGSKGVQVSRQEDGVLGSLGPPGDLEESASNHLGHSLLVREGVRSTLLSREHMEKCSKNHKNQIF